MKPLDAVKVLMGIRSARDCVKRFEFDGLFWAKYLDYDYPQMLDLSETVVNDYYLEAIA